MQINKILLTGLLCALNFFSNAQNVPSVVRGRVTDNGQEPIEGASVWIRSLKLGTVTATDGSFELKVVRLGTYTIEVTAIGYLPKKHTLEIRQSSSSQVDFSLSKDSRQMETVMVTGLTEKRKLTESGFNVNGIETKALANTTADLNQVLSRSAGINIRETGGLGSDFNFSINGLSGKQIKFFIDGIPMENFGRSMSLNNIPVNLAERIEVYKGVVPVELGADALGGAINIVTNQRLKEYADISYSMGSFNTHRAGLNMRHTDRKTGFTVNLNGFYNYSDNNYKMKDIVLPNATVPGDYRRFNDAFRSYMGQVEFGFRDQKWADVLMIGLLYSSNYKERQTGTNPYDEKVYGKVNSSGDFLMPSFRFKKTNLLTKGLSASLFTTYAKDNSNTVDTSVNRYNWNQEIIETNNNFGEQGAFSLYKYHNKFAIVSANLAYQLNAGNSFSLNYNLSAGRRQGVNNYPTANQGSNALDVPNKLDKSVLGLSWQNNLLDERLTTSIFAKNYRLHTYTREAIFYNGTGYVKEESDQTDLFYGYGIASRYKLTSDIGIKASFEHAYRLPEVEELFGDGISVLANISLRPEESDNVNLGAYLSKRFGKYFLGVEASGFYRNAKNFINMTASNPYSIYSNTNKVKVTGFDAEAKFSYGDFLSATINASYTNIINIDESSTVYEDRFPNQPWLLGNADLGLTKNNFLSKGGKLQFNWYSQYVHEFYLTWPSRADKSGKAVIPTQLIHNAALTYSNNGGKYNLTLESKNLFDALAFDNFRLQKAGRAFYIKLRYFIQKNSITYK